MRKVKKIKRVCRECGSDFFVYPSSLKKDGCFYCCRQCFWKGFRREMRLSGRGSGAKGKHWKHTMEYRKKLSKARTGALNPAWKGGSTRCRYNDMGKYARWRKAVFERDDYTCVECDKRGGTLNAHHIEPWATNVRLRYVLRNGVTLCVKCHRYVHWDERIRMASYNRLFGNNEKTIN